MSFQDFFLLVNKWHPEYTDTVSSAKIFEIETEDVIECQTRVEYQLKNYPQYCLLPFQSIIIRYHNYPMVLMISDPRDDLLGYFVDRNVWIFIPWVNFKAEFISNGDDYNSIEDKDVINSIRDDSYIFIAGKIVPDAYEAAISFQYHCSSIMGVDEITRDIRSRHGTAVIYDLFNNNLPIFINWICGNLLLLNHPDKFVVQVDSVQKPRYPWETEEGDGSDSTYILMRPDQIQKIAGSNNLGSKKMPHQRRRHFRTLGSDYYKKKKGQTIVIPATWIGETQIQKGDKIYKVLIDK